MGMPHAFQAFQMVLATLAPQTLQAVLSPSDVGMGMPHHMFVRRPTHQDCSRCALCPVPKEFTMPIQCPSSAHPMPISVPIAVPITYLWEICTLGVAQ